MKDKWVASERRVKGELPVELMTIEKNRIHHLLATKKMEAYDAWQKDDGFVPVEIQLSVGRLPLAGSSPFWAFARGKLAAAGEKSQGMTYEITCWTGHLTVRITFTKLVPTSSWARGLFDSISRFCICICASFVQIANHIHRPTQSLPSARLDQTLTRHQTTPEC